MTKIGLTEFLLKESAGYNPNNDINECAHDFLYNLLYYDKDILYHGQMSDRSYFREIYYVVSIDIDGSKVFVGFNGLVSNNDEDWDVNDVDWSIATDVYLVEATETVIPEHTETTYKIIEG